MPRTKGSKNKHHKPKHHKEKKSRGRPKGSTQRQKQNQTIKININNSGNENHKENMLPIPNGIATQVLSNIPNEFPVNRQEVNPPLYDMNSLIQPIISSISHSNKINIPQFLIIIQNEEKNIDSFNSFILYKF
jgi:hypothetical protein